MVYSGHFGDVKAVDKIILLLSEIWVKTEEEKAETQSSKVDDGDTLKQEHQKIKGEINKLKTDNANISFDEWYEQLTKLRDKIQNIAERNFPHSWAGIEFTLSVLKILNIAECNLPFAGIILSRAGGNKTLSSGMVTRWPYVYYTRNFSARAFVSHNTAIKREKLPEVDMLPEMRFKLFLTPELTPTFTANEDQLMETIGIITSVLDGKGYTSHTGAQGRRSYYGNYTFVWIGAAVDIPYRVHKLLATLGPKLHFFRLPRIEKSDDELLDCLNANFTEKYKQVEDTVIDYLKWFEVCPRLIEDKETKLLTILWDSEQDDQSAKDYTVKLGKLLAKLRGHVEIWSSRKTEHEHEYSGYEYGFTDTEDPARACTQMYNLARGHALLNGRNYIKTEDLHIVVKVVLSTASIERVAILDLLLAKKAPITLSEITRSLSMSKSTALKAMTALSALKVVNMKDAEIEHNYTKQITLSNEFDWLYDKAFADLRQGFNPVDNSKYDFITSWTLFEELESDSPDKTVDGDEFEASLIRKGFDKNGALTHPTR